MANIGTKLKQLRIDKGYTQEDVASKIGLTRQAISSYESGRTQPGVDLLMQFANIYDVELNQLLGGESEKVKSCRFLLKTAALAFTGIWAIFQLLHVLLCAAAVKLYPILTYAETAAELKQNEIHFQLTSMASRFDQSSLNLMLYGCIIMVLVHLFTKQTVTKQNYIRLILSCVSASILLLLLAYLLLEDYAVNVMVSLRFSWYILLPALLIDALINYFFFLKKSKHH